MTSLWLAITHWNNKDQKDDKPKESIPIQKDSTHGRYNKYTQCSYEKILQEED